MTQPDLYHYMASRRSVPAKTMTGPGPDEAAVRDMLRVASRVPDHGKLAPWRFIRYTPDHCRRLGELALSVSLERNPSLGEAARAEELGRFLRAPVVIALVSRAAPHPKIPVWEQELSAGAAGMALLIAANALGFEGQWISEWVAYDEAMREALGVEPGERIAGFFHLGQATLPKTDRDRPDLASVYSVMGN